MEKEVNGVVSGPAAWRATFAAHCREANFSAHRTSPCTFVFWEPMWRSGSGVYYPTKEEADRSKGSHGECDAQLCPEGLGGLICVLVDDVLGGGRGVKFREALEWLKTKVKFGKWEGFKEEREYGGKSIRQHPNGAITLPMEKYVGKLSELEITREEERNPTGRANESQKKAFRTLVGGLLCAARTGVPQIYGDCSILAGKVTDLCHADRVALNKSLMRARETVTSITYPSCPPAESHWVVWADASLAQDQEGKLLKNQKGWIAPVAWSSHRLKRVATSTLLAELIAIAESVAEAEWLLHWEGLVLDKNYNLPRHQDSVNIVVKSIMRPDPS
eukprot:196990-Amphidinium_carterae.1